MRINNINNDKKEVGFGLKLASKNLRQLGQELLTPPVVNEKALVDLLDALDAKGFKKSVLIIGDSYTDSEKPLSKVFDKYDVNGQSMDVFYRDVELHNPVLNQMNLIQQVKKEGGPLTLKETVENILTWDFKNMDNVHISGNIQKAKVENPEVSALEYYSGIVDDLRLNGTSSDVLLANAKFAKMVDENSLESTKGTKISALRNEIDRKQNDLMGLLEEYNNEHQQITRTSNNLLYRLENPDNERIDKIVDTYS